MEFTIARQVYVWSRSRWTALIVASLVCVPCMAAEGEDSLHGRIDASIAELHPGPESSLCSDGEFLRRAHLDLAGTIPTGNEAREFIDDPSPDKRTKLIQRLLADPAYAEHMAQVFDLMLMERRADKHVKADQWKPYLLASFQQNKPFNELAREILAADGVDEKQRGPAKFYLEREVEPNLITREVGRIFFGMDLQCAQCHDHPNIDDYYQSDYYGLFAFVNRSYLFQPDTKKPAVLAEKAEGDAKFKSVFTEEEGQTLPRLPGSVEIDEPTFGKDDAYRVKPDPKKKEVRPVPKHSRRKELAARATDGSNRAFNRNLANRLWAHMMGRGLVHPVDQHHSDNPPTHPQLLEMLADELASTDFDVKSMLRELALSRTYQRTIDLPVDFVEHAKSASEQRKRWEQRSAEATDAARQTQAAVGDLEKQRQEAGKQLPVLDAAKKKATESLAASSKTAAEAEQAMAAGQQSLAEKQKLNGLLAEAVAKTTEAAAQLSNDQELGDVLKILTARQQDAGKQVDEFTSNMAALSTAHQATQQKLTEAQNVSAEATRKRQATQQMLVSLANSMAAAEQRLLFDRTVVSHAKQQITRFKIADSYGESVRQQQTLQGETRQLANQIASSEQAIARLQQELEQFKANLPKAESDHADAATAAAKATADLESTRRAAELIAASLANAGDAAKILSDDAELKAAVGKLETRSSQLSTDVASLEKLVATTSDRAEQLATTAQSLREAMTKAKDEFTAAQVQTQESQRRHAAKSQQLAELSEPSEAQRDALTAAWSELFSIALAQPLTPEQLATSILKTTGYDKRQRASVQAALDKKSPLKPEEKDDPAKLAAREKEIATETEKKLNAIVGRFVKLFGAAAGQPQDDFFATVDQALFFGNGGELRSWLAPTGDNLTDRLQKVEDPKKLAEELYLSVLTRLPNDQETAEVTEYLTSAEKQKRDAVQELAWALLTSAEFRFQH
jgi:hypothetical protein